MAELAGGKLRAADAPDSGNVPESKLGAGEVSHARDRHLDVRRARFITPYAKALVFHQVSEGHRIPAQGQCLSGERASGLSVKESNLTLAGGDDLVDAGDAVVEEVRDPPLLLDHNVRDAGVVRSFAA